jgi:uncharacterized membrane protein
MIPESTTSACLLATRRRQRIFFATHLVCARPSGRRESSESRTRRTKREERIRGTLFRACPCSRGFLVCGARGSGGVSRPWLRPSRSVGTHVLSHCVGSLGQEAPKFNPHGAACLSTPDLLVTLTGVLEILGAIGLFVPSTARLACICLALLLVALFPANIHAARQHLTIAGRRMPRLPVQSAMQLVFVATLIAAAWLAPCR